MKLRALERRRGTQRGGERSLWGVPISAVLPLAEILLLSVLVFAGCGYQFSVGPTLPQGIKSVSFAEFQNETLEAGVEKELQWALEREFRSRGGIAVADRGEGIVSATLHRLDFRPLSFDRRDQVLEYEVALLFDVAITHRDTGQVLWQANNIRVAEDYSAVPQVIVTTSPKFFQGTLNPEDLAGLTDIQFSQTQRRLALERLFVEAAREVYFRLGEHF
jgi:outer membrane lipopolysaccharide assembly protein LptE/RlpB